MSQLIWRPIEAPRFDMQGLAQNAAGITNAFDRFGQTLINKEESIRTEATDAAIAEAMALQDPDEVKARLQAGAGGLGRKVNARDFMEALGAHQNQLMDTSLKNEEVLNAKAYAELGDEGAALLNAATTGNREAMDKVMALASENPLWARVAQPFMKDAAGAFDQADTRGITRTRDANTHQYQLGGLANDRERIAIDRQRAAGEGQEREFRIQALREQEQERRDGKRADQYGSRWAKSFIGRMDPGHIPDLETATTLALRHLPKGHTPEQEAAIVANLKTEFGRRFNSTNDEREQITASMPSVASAAADARTQESRLTDAAFRANPGLMIKNRVAGMDEKYVAGLTLPGVAAKIGKQGLRDPGGFVERALAQGATLAEIDALADSTNLSGPGFIESVALSTLSRGAQGGATGGTVGAAAGSLAGGVGAAPGAAAGVTLGGLAGGLYGAGEGLYDYFTGGTKKGTAALDSVRNTDVVEAAQLELNRDTQPIQDALREQQRLAALALHEKTALGRPSAQTLARIARNEKRLKAVAGKK